MKRNKTIRELKQTQRYIVSLCVKSLYTHQDYTDSDEYKSLLAKESFLIGILKSNVK